MSTPARQLYCVLIALVDDTLLLPNAAVIETVGQQGLTVNEAEPLWVAGELVWNARALTAVRFETLNRAAAAPIPKRSKLVVLHGQGGEAGDAPLALVAQGYPHLITVSRDAIKQLPLRTTDNPSAVLARVRVGNSEALIPDLDHLRLQISALN
jgi:chemosensory pili system protein ChpC